MNGIRVEAPWYYKIDTWENLKRYLGSDKTLVKPLNDLISYHEWNPIGVDSENER